MSSVKEKLKFHSYVLSKDVEPDERSKSLTVDEYYREVMLMVNAGMIDNTRVLPISAENMYVRHGMKFCQVRPNVVDEVFACELVPWKDGVSSAMQAFCFAVDHEPVVRGGKLTSFLVWISGSGFIWMSVNYIKKDKKLIQTLDFIGLPEHMDAITDNDVRRMAKLAFGLTKLVKDKSRTKPIVSLGRTGLLLK